jgi:hypothetical protein
MGPVKRNNSAKWLVDLQGSTALVDDDVLTLNAKICCVNTRDRQTQQYCDKKQ